MLQCIESAKRNGKSWRGESLLTWDNVPRVHRIFIFDETKPIHELNLGDFASSMCAEVLFDILLGS
jgi:hypothetical protein